MSTAQTQWLETAVSDIREAFAPIPSSTDVVAQRLAAELRADTNRAAYELRQLGPGVHTLGQCSPTRAAVVTAGIQVI